MAGSSDGDAHGAPPEEPQVFWDGYGLGRRGSGVHHHAHELALALDPLGVRPTIFMADTPAEPVGPNLKTIILPRARLVGPLGRSKLLWPTRVGTAMLDAVTKGSPAILHGLSNFNLPADPSFYRRCRTVLTVHDLIPFLAKRDVSPALVWQLKLLWPLILPRVDCIVCVSRWTKETLIEHYPETEGKVVVIPNGLPVYQGRAKNPSEDGKIRLLSVSRLEGYKRLEYLAEIVRKENGRFVCHLVTSPEGVLWAERAHHDLVRKGRLVVKSRLSDEEMEREFSAADVYVQTSLFEGFCLPAGEAMAHGVPVVYQSGSGIDEVVGARGGIAMSRYDKADRWIQAIEAAARLGDDDKFQEKLKDSLASKATWDKAATTLAEVYDKLIK